MSSTSARINNFDLIRLLAAFQVVYGHALHHLNIENKIVIGVYEHFLKYFPGVPIFFFISGLLIWGSFERNSDKLKKFFVNRGLRLFPALWFASILLLGILWYEYLVTGNTQSFFSKGVFVWFLGQISIFQFYTPEILRFWGVGTPNGSLWTIGVEIQFYIVVPIMFILFKYLKKYKQVAFIIIFGLSIATNVIVKMSPSESMIVKLMGVFVFPYLYYFMVGILTFMYYDKIIHFFRSKFLYWLVAYIVFFCVADMFLGYDVVSYWVTSPFNVIGTFLLSGVTLSAAYTAPTLSEKLVKGNDISYGVYLYHMVVVNFIVHKGWVNNEWIFLVVFVVTTLLALFSWHVIEKRSLNLKNKLL